MTSQWRPVVNAVLYMVRFAPALDAAEVNRVAVSLLRSPLGDLTPEQEYQALVDALDSGEELDVVVRVQHSPSQVRTFLGDLVAELDEMRPWQAPPLQEIPMTRWPDFATAAPVARISVPWPPIEGRVDKTFKSVDGGQGVLVRLRSGTELALVWPSGAGKSGTDVIAPGAVPSAVVAELIEATALNDSDVAIL